MYEVRARKFSYNGTTMYDLLKTIDDPAALRRLDRRQLQPLADELRAFVLDSVSQTGGHLSSNLGTVELTIALHYVFDTPHDRIVWTSAIKPIRTRS
jgi:1-deoxy-D-xylulose-5-phosphate synthase